MVTVFQKKTLSTFLIDTLVQNHITENSVQAQGLMLLKDLLILLMVEQNWKAKFQNTQSSRLFFPDTKKGLK